MSNTVTGSVKGTINVAETLGSGIESGQQLPLTLAWRSIFSTSGTLADQCNLIYANTLSMVASTAQSIDLSNLTDLFNNTIDFTGGGAGGRVRFVAFRHQGEVDGSFVEVGGAASNPWLGFLSSGSSITVFPSSTVNDGWFIITAPNTTGMVVSSTSRILLLTPSAHNFNFDVVIGGCNA
jgi:hypothetical protein